MSFHLQLMSFWGIVAMVAHFAGAFVAALAASVLVTRRARYGVAGDAVAASLLATVAWCLVASAAAPSSTLAALAEALRNLAYIFALYRLFECDGRHTNVGPVRPVIASLAFVGFLECAMLVMQLRMGITAPANPVVFQFDILLRLLLSIGGLVLVHNLYVGSANETRRALRWPAGALALMWGFDLNFYTIAYLIEHWPEELGSMRGPLAAAFGVLLALGAGERRDKLRFKPSRAVTFQSVSLLLIGAYLVAMVAIAQWIAYSGGNFARLLQFGFVIATTTFAIVVLPSQKLRGWLRVTLHKHLFQHCYDYRAEWLRFTQTMGRVGEFEHPLEERVVQAIADITDSPAGFLLTPNEAGELELAARWQWSTAEIPATALGADGIAFLERHGFIVDLEDVRAGKDHQGEKAIVPQWLRDETRAWAVVPLVHYERLVGAVVLARPPHGRKLDWEDFDLLRVVAQQLASYLAEHAGQRALAEAGRFDDFNRRIAFVMHDIKNLASQFSLLAHNAERHAENPAFRADMLVTLRNSADKLNALIARLSRYGTGAIEQIGEVRADLIAQAVAEQFHDGHAVVASATKECTISANAETLEQVLVHLVQNAIDASPPEAPVFIGVSSDGIYGQIEVLDSGSGMSPEFVRTRLFRPFVSSKPGGFGIGAYEARELVRAMNGRLDVKSREGLGSRFVIRLPVHAATDLIQNIGKNGQKVA